MTKLLKFILPLAVMLSAFSGCNNIINDNSQQSQETTSQTASETVSETTAEQAEAKKELKGDMTIRKAYKLPDLGRNVVENTPTLIGNKAIVGIKTGEALAKYNVSDEVNDYELGIYPIDIVAVDGITGEKKIVYSDVMLDSYSITPGNDEKTAYIEYCDKTNMADMATAKTMEDVQKHKRVIKLDLENASHKELDFSKYDGTNFTIHPIGKNKLVIEQFEYVTATEKDFEGRNVEFNDEDSTVESRAIDIMDLNSGKIENFFYDKMNLYSLIPGEKKIGSFSNYFSYYDDTVIYNTEEVTADNADKVGFQVYDENMNLVYEDVVDSIDNYKNGFINLYTIISNGDIYVFSNKYIENAGGDTKKIESYYIYHKKGNTYEKTQASPTSDNDPSSYQFIKKTHPEINYGMVQITDGRPATCTQLQLFNCCTGEELFLDIDIEGLKIPYFIYQNLGINNDGSGNMIVLGDNPDGEAAFEYWFVPKEEIKRALYGE